MTSKSQVWNFFTKNLKERKIQCNLCRKYIQFTDNTTNLLSHLKVWHINEYNKSRSKPQTENLVISDDDDEILSASSSKQLQQTSLVQNHEFEVLPCSTEQNESR